MGLIRLDNRILAVLVVALLAVGVGAGYEVGSSGGTTRVSTERIVSTTTSVSTATSVSTTTNVSTATIVLPTTETTTRTTTIRVTEPAPGEIPSIATIEEGNVTIEGYPSSIAVDDANAMLYISDAFSNVVTVVNSATDTVEEQITMPATPTGIVVDSGTNTIFISIGDCTNALNASNSCVSTPTVTTPPKIFAMNGSTNGLSWVTRVNAQVVAVDEDRGVLYATQGMLVPPNGNSTGDLLALNSSSGAVMANISLAAYPEGVAFNPRTNMLYVPACQIMSLVCVGAEVIGVNGTDSTISTTIPVSGYGFSGIAVDPATNTGYLVTYSNVSSLVSINLNSDKQVYSTVLGSSCADIDLVGIGYREPFAGQLFAVASDEQTTDGLLLVIDPGSGNIINMFSSPEPIVGFAVDLSTGMLYSTIESLSTHQTSGSLVSLNGIFPPGFVNTGLMEPGLCLP